MGPIRVAVCHCLERQQPPRVALHGRCAAIQHYASDLFGLAGKLPVAGMNSDTSERDDAGSVKKVHNFLSGVAGESFSKSGRRVWKSAHLQELPPSPRLEDVEGPRLPFALGNEDVLLRDQECLVESVNYREHIATPLRRKEATALHNSSMLKCQTCV